MFLFHFTNQMMNRKITFTVLTFLTLQLLIMAAKTKWGTVKDHLTAAPTHDPDAALEANLENADPELCIRLLQVRQTAFVTV